MRRSATTGSTDRRTLAVLLVVFLGGSLALAVGVAVNERDDGDGARPPAEAELPRDGSVVVERRPADALLPDGVPRTYDVTYLVQSPQDGRVTETTDRVRVRRPFDGRVDSAAGGRPLTSRVSRLGALVIDNGRGRGTVIAAPPALATGDIRPDVALAEVAGAGLVKPAEQRRVAGRTCQVWRLGSTAAAGSLVPLGERAGERAEVCIDADGLVLEEVWHLENRWVRRRLATEVRADDPALDDAVFRLSEETELPADQGNGFVRAMDPATLPEGPGWEGATVPEGFTHLGRFAVTAPDLQGVRDPLNPPEGRAAVSTVDVWTRGADVIVVDQTIVAQPRARLQPQAGARPVELGPHLGPDGETFGDLRGNEVRVSLPEDRYVRVFGTVAVDDLVAVARSLRPVQGAGVRLL